VDFDQTSYGEDDPADTPSDAVGPALSMVEVARYWNRRDGGSTRLDLAAEVAEAREARQLAAILESLGEVSSPLAPLEVLEVRIAGRAESDDWTARALRRLGFRVETTDEDPAEVSRASLFDLVLAPAGLSSDAVTNLESLVRLGGRLILADKDTGVVLAWTREN
jgi:hypothetical protein